MVYVIVDEPQGAYYGGVVAAPIAKEIFEKIFEYSSFDESDSETKEEFLLDSYIGQSLAKSAADLSSKGLQYLVQGDGDYVTNQIPAPGASVSENDIVLLIFE